MQFDAVLSKNWMRPQINEISTIEIINFKSDDE